jgi:protein-S-isoprenylcysteine O-methyltransferase Ste14
MPFDLHRALNAMWAAVGSFWLAGAFTAKRAVKKQPWASRIWHAAWIAVAFYLLFNPRVLPGPLRERAIPATEPWGWIAFCLTLAGLLFSVWARLHIGRNWSGTVTVKENHELMRTGPYALVRHPIYSGFIFAALGTAVGYGNIGGFLAVIVTVAGWRIKANLEERFMTGQFGEQYEQYRGEVKGLIPFVW